MFRKSRHSLFGFVATLAVAFFAFVGSAWAAVEVNTADSSQLESIKGIGPAMSGKIIAERKQGNYKDWSDFEKRVSGVGEKNAAGFSRAGLTVAGKVKEGAQPSPDAARGAKPGTKTSATSTDATGSTLAKK